MGGGSLSLYTGSFPSTMRVVTDMNLVLGAGTGIDTYIQIQRYTWYVLNYKAPVFQISIIDINGPLATAHQKVTTVSTLTTGIESIDKNLVQFNVNPNPAGSNAQVVINLLRNSEVNLKISDVIGRIWKEENHDFISGMNKVSLDLSDLPKGIYIISANSGAMVRKQRIVID